MMNKIAKTTLLMGILWMGTGANIAQAVRYTQILPNSTAPAPYSSPAIGTNQPSGQIYQGQIHQSVTVPTLKVAQIAAPQALQSPKAILDNLKLKNNVPAEVAATISVEKSNTLNAYTNGQTIVVTSGLLDKLTTNDQRAFVISHELSHVLLSHVAKTQVRRVGLSLFDALLLRRYVGQGTALDLASRFGIGLVDKHSARGYEYQADDLGVRLMASAGYDPAAALKVFAILKANTPANQTPGFLMDHPITDDRIRVLVQKYQLKAE